MHGVRCEVKTKIEDWRYCGGCYTEEILHSVGHLNVFSSSVSKILKGCQKFLCESCVTFSQECHSLIPLTHKTKYPHPLKINGLQDY